MWLEIIEFKDGKPTRQVARRAPCVGYYSFLINITGSFVSFQPKSKGILPVWDIVLLV